MVSGTMAPASAAPPVSTKPPLSESNSKVMFCHIGLELCAARRAVCTAEAISAYAAAEEKSSPETVPLRPPRDRVKEPSVTAWKADSWPGAAVARKKGALPAEVSAQKEILEGLCCCALTKLKYVCDMAYSRLLKPKYSPTALAEVNSSTVPEGILDAAVNRRKIGSLAPAAACPPTPDVMSTYLLWLIISYSLLCLSAPK